MTKLQLLHRAVNERLMAAVEQIMEMVGGTVLEYEEETVRARKENEILRRRLQWMEGENSTDWPDPTDFYVPGEANLTETLELDSVIIKTEPIDHSDFQPYGPNTSLTASVCTANMEVVHPGTSGPASVDIPDDTAWDSRQSYMAPLDFDPTMSNTARNRNQRRSFACPDCGKVFTREQSLIFHMRVHSGERPYTYRHRKTCFYGEKKRIYVKKTNLCDLAKESAEPVNVSVSGESSEHTHDLSLKHKKRRKKPIVPQCLECNKVFNNVSRLVTHMRIHINPPPREDEHNKQQDHDKTESHISRAQRLQKIILSRKLALKNPETNHQKKYKCTDCKKVFDNQEPLRIHRRRHHRKDPPKKLYKLIKIQPHKKRRRGTMAKIFDCPQCNKAFTTEFRLASHVRSHATQPPHKSDILCDAILPTSRRSQRVVTQPSTEGSSKEKAITEQSFRETSVSKKIPPELITNPETQIIISSNVEDINNESESISYGTQTISYKLEEDSSGQKEAAKKSKKRFPCLHCDKVYKVAGRLKTHMQIHINQRIYEVRMRSKDQNDNKDGVQSLVETNIIEKKTLVLQDNLEDKNNNPHSNEVTGEFRHDSAMDLVGKPNVTSPIWEHFGFVPNKKDEPSNLEEAICRLCGKKISVKWANTSNLHSHLRSCHLATYTQLMSSEPRRPASQLGIAEDVTPLGSATRLEPANHQQPPVQEYSAISPAPRQKQSEKKPKKALSCQVCGKVYLLPGCLKTHEQMHKNERFLEDRRSQLIMSKFEQNNNKAGVQSLMERNIIEKKPLVLLVNLEDTFKTKNQLSNEVDVKSVGSAPLLESENHHLPTGSVLDYSSSPVQEYSVISPPPNTSSPSEMSSCSRLSNSPQNDPQSHHPVHRPLAHGVILPNVILNHVSAEVEKQVYLDSEGPDGLPRADRFAVSLFKRLIPLSVYQEWTGCVNYDGSRGKNALPSNLRQAIAEAVGRKFQPTSHDWKLIRDRINELLRKRRLSFPLF